MYIVISSLSQQQRLHVPYQDMNQAPMMWKLQLGTRAMLISGMYATNNIQFQLGMVLVKTIFLCYYLLVIPNIN